MKQLDGAQSKPRQPESTHPAWAPIENADESSARGILWLDNNNRCGKDLLVFIVQKDCSTKKTNNIWMEKLFDRASDVFIH